MRQIIEDITRAAKTLLEDSAHVAGQSLADPDDIAAVRERVNRLTNSQTIFRSLVAELEERRSYCRIRAALYIVGGVVIGAIGLASAAVASLPLF